MANAYVIHNGELYHYGVKGMKWGVRRAERRQNSFQKKIDRINRYEDKYATSLMDTRRKNRSKIENKYDKKVAKATAKGNADKAQRMTSKKKAVLDDFDAGTKNIKKALDVGKENKTTFLELKKKAVTDPSIKKSPQYKNAKSWYNSQMYSESQFGKATTVLYESMYAARGKSWTRKYL